MDIKLSLIIFIFLCLIGCETKELPIPPKDRGGVYTEQITLNSNYGSQVYYSLTLKKIMKNNKITDWDLGFESSQNGSHVILNTSRNALAASSNKTDFASVNSLNNLNWICDFPNGDYQKLAIGSILNNLQVYVIDRGYDENGNHAGYFKIQFLEVNNNYYKIKVGTIEDEIGKEMYLFKDYQKNFVFYSFDTKTVVDLAPNKFEWDLLFTKYIHVFENPLMYYSVVGVLINPSRIQVAIDTLKDFSEVNKNDLNQYTFFSEWDKIGYNWKKYDLSSGFYVIVPNRTYIIKNIDNQYYKLRFVDFYNNGLKGYPKFEFQEL